MPNGSSGIEDKIDAKTAIRLVKYIINKCLPKDQLGEFSAVLRAAVASYRGLRAWAAEDRVGSGISGSPMPGGSKVPYEDGHRHPTAMDEAARASFAEFYPLTQLRSRWDLIFGHRGAGHRRVTAAAFTLCILMHGG
jgi:hypothetical protein